MFCGEKQLDCNLRQKVQTWRGSSRAADISDARRGYTALLALDQLPHGSVHAGLDVAPGSHVLGLLLAPHHLGIRVLHHYLHINHTAFALVYKVQPVAGQG